MLAGSRGGSGAGGGGGGGGAPKANGASARNVELRPILADEMTRGASPPPPRGASKKSARSVRSVDDDTGTDLDVNESNHSFHCGGRCVTGPPEEDCDFQRAMLIIYALVFVAYALLSGFLLFEFFPLLAAMPLVYLLLDFCAFLLTGCTDPGVVTPQPDRGTTPDPSRRYCKTCNVYQDDGQRHCSFCNACVRELDHHCGVTGTCIGARNKVHFTMLFFYYMMSFWALITAIVYIAICTTLSTSSGFSGSFAPAVEISAHAFGVAFAVLAVLSFAFWVLAYFDLLGDCGLWVYRFFCCVPMARRGASLLTTDIEREPACGPMTPCAICTIPKREFYPD